MAESPTARGQDYFNLRNRIAGALDVILGEEPHPREQECIDAILAVWSTLSLADLAVLLREVGHDAFVTRRGWVVGDGVLVVAAKEPPTSNDELRRLAAEVLRQGPPIDPTP